MKGAALCRVRQVSTQAQREEFTAALSRAEDWIYDESDGEDAPAFRCGEPPYPPTRRRSYVCSMYNKMGLLPARKTIERTLSYTERDAAHDSCTAWLAPGGW